MIGPTVARKPTPSELIAALADAHAAMRRTCRPSGVIECPWCHAETAAYQFYEPLCMASTVWCPCGFGMRQGFGVTS